MLLAFNVGNTNTSIALFGGERLFRTSEGPTRGVHGSDVADPVRRLLRDAGFELHQVRDAAIASVVPAVSPLLIDACQRLGLAVFNLDATAPLPIRLDVDEPMHVGPDRLANAIAAARFNRNVIAVDLGTATTFDCVTADGVFVGGAIAPGAVTGADALASRTARLPLVELRPPDSAIGRRTETAILSGVFHGAVASVDGTVERIIAEWRRPDVLVLATGGLAGMLAPWCRTIHRVEPHLTLQGLQLAWQHARARHPRPPQT
jgi:type III pantothenate kinase